MKMLSAIRETLFGTEPALFTLIYCEKPSTAKLVARAVNASEKIEGAFCGNGHIVTWGYGYMFSLEESPVRTPGFKHHPLLPSSWKLLPKPKVESQLELIRRLSVLCNKLIIATDADEAGELIGRQLIEHLGWVQSAFRILIPSATLEGVRAAMQFQVDLNITQRFYERALLRRRMDWIVSKRVAPIIGERIGTDLVLGRSILPTIRLLVERESEIRNHAGGDLYLTVSCPEGNAKASWRPVRGIVHRTGALNDHLMSLDEESLACSIASCEEIILPPPGKYSLTDLIADSCALFGMRAGRVREIAQSLYERGIFSYPRVNDTNYFGLMPGISVIGSPDWNEDRETLLVFCLAALREEASTSKSASIKLTHWTASTDLVVISWDTAEILRDGWLTEYLAHGYLDILPAEVRLPRFCPSRKSVTVLAIVRPDHSRFNEGTLLRAMSSGVRLLSGAMTKIGSDASRVETLCQLYSSGFAVREGDGYIKPTPRAHRLLDALPDGLVDFLIFPEARIESEFQRGSAISLEEATTVLADELVDLCLLQELESE